MGNNSVFNNPQSQP